MKKIIEYIAAVAATYVLGALVYSQLNTGNLATMGIEVTAGLRVDAAIHDVLNMYDLYLPIVAVALLIGFLVAGLIIRWVPQLRTLGYILAGFTAIFTVDMALVASFMTHPLAVTRTTMGLLSLCVTGALGGYVFSVLTAPTDEISYLAQSANKASGN